MPALSATSDLSGRVVNDGHYQLIQPLGSGTYGVVYKALDLAFSLSSTSSKTSPWLAIKVLCKEDMGSSAARRVRREVAFHHKMSRHPNVVAMHDAFEDADYVYIVLDYCPGGDLFGKVVDEKLYFGRDALTKSVFVQILDAVEGCHQKRIYHRDLKPENILVNRDGTKVYLSDFGLSTKTQVSEEFGCGSSYYMSPECIGRETGLSPFSNRASDVWSVGVILVNMISSRSPWSKALTSDNCFCEFLLNENYFREMLPISESANTILRQIFAYEPSERITIPALRKAIVDLDTFFMTDEEIMHATDAVRMAAAHCGVVIQDGRAAVDVAPHATATTPRPAEIEALVCSVEGDLDRDSGSSAADSDAPVTPAAYAQELERAISEFKLQLSDFGQPESEEDAVVGGCRVNPLDVKVNVRIVSLEETYDS